VETDQELITLANEILEKLNALNEKKVEFEAVSDLADNPMPIFLDIKSKLALVIKFEIGPAVGQQFVPVDDIATYLDGTQKPTDVIAITDNANRLRILANPEWPAEHISLTGLPSPEFTGVKDYSYQACDDARRKGPRMLVSYLLSLPMDCWMKYGQEVYRELEKQQEYRA